MTTPGAHQSAQGRMALPHRGFVPNIIHVNPHVTPSPLLEDFGPSPFLPEDENSPFTQPLALPPVNEHSPMMLPSHFVRTTDHLESVRQDLYRNQSIAIHQPPPQHRRLGRPPMPQRHTMQVLPRPAPLHRQASLQAPARSASPHMSEGDVFDPMPGSPVKRPVSSLGLVEHGTGYKETYQFAPDMVSGIVPRPVLIK